MSNKKRSKYILKCYNDEYAYGEEGIWGFATKEDAEIALRKAVEEDYGMIWNRIPKALGLSKDDTFRSDYVSIGNGYGDTMFYIVEEIRPGKTYAANDGYKYILKSYNDEHAYGEEKIKGFRTKKDAKAALRATVEEDYKMVWSEIPKALKLSRDDTFRSDYVAIGNGCGDTMFYIVEEIRPGETFDHSDAPVLKREITISADEALTIDKLLHTEPTSRDECMDEDETITYTADFGNGMEVDVKVCGVQFWEFESNLPWTEAVLFRNGCEVCCSEPSEELLGTWELECDGQKYEVTVRAEVTTCRQMRELRDGDCFYVHGKEKFARGDAHLTGNASYDRFIVYDTDGKGWLEDEFPKAE